MLCYGDRAFPRAPSAMRDGKGFMQVQVTNIGPDDSRVGQPDLGVHVGAVHVYLSAVFMDDADDVEDLLLKHTMG